MNEPDFKRLWIAYAEGALPFARASEFVRILDRNPALAQQVLDDLDFAAELEMALGKSGDTVATEVWAKIGRVRFGALPKKAGQTTRRKGGHGRTRLFFAWALPMAAAAVLAVGLFLFSAPESLDYRVVRQIGTVAFSDTRAHTGPDGGALIEFKDGTLLALDRGADMRFGFDSDRGERIWHQEAGRVYLATPPGARSPVVHAGDATVRLLGTRLEIVRDPFPLVRVFEGAVHLTFGRGGEAARTHGRVADGEEGNYTSVRIPAGWAAQAMDGDKDTGIFYSRGDGVAGTFPDWIRFPEMSAADANGLGFPDQAPSFSEDDTVLFLRGDWSVSEDEGLAVRQHLDIPERTRTGAILSPLSPWKRFRVSYRYRILNFGERENFNVGGFLTGKANVAILGIEFPVTREMWLQYGRTQQAWIRVVYEFKREPDGGWRLVMAIGPENMPEKTEHLSAQGPAYFGLDESLRFGVSTIDCQAEFADIRFRVVE